MTQLIDKSALVAEIKKRNEESWLGHYTKEKGIVFDITDDILSFIDTIEVIDPYEPFIQYPSREDGVKAHAEDYSFNIESELFNQLTKEQQKLWRKEIEQACISGGYSGLNLAKDPRYKENLEVKEVDLDKEIKDYFGNQPVVTRSKGVDYQLIPSGENIAKHFFELGLKAQKGEKV